MENATKWNVLEIASTFTSCMLIILQIGVAASCLVKGLKLEALGFLLLTTFYVFFEITSFKRRQKHEMQIFVIKHEMDMLQCLQSMQNQIFDLKKEMGNKND